MPDKPVVFLSSTLRSLRTLRSTLEDKIRGLGYDFSFAECDFSPPPGLSIAEECLRKVDECDILVLIVDGTYGTPVNGEWLVRSEFARAKRQRKAIYVVVQQQAWYGYQLATKHADVAPDNYEIHPEVVRFLREIEHGGRHWISPFETERDLTEKLKEKFAADYALLLRSRSGALLVRTAHLLEQMHNLYRHKNHVQALLFAEDVLRIDPDNSEALVTRAVSRIRLHGLSHTESINEGIKDCEQVLANNPRDYRARYNLANFKLLSPEYDIPDVEAELEKLYSEFPEYRFYFAEDGEFKRLMDLRKSWSRQKKRRGHSERG